MQTVTSPPPSEGRVKSFARRHVPPRPAPVARRDLALAVAMGRITPELAALYEVHDGLMLDQCDIFDVKEMMEHPAQATIGRAFPGAVMFGWDRSGYLFFIDAQNSMYRGAGAVFAVDKVYIEPATCLLCAPDLASFLEATETCRMPWFGPRLIDQQIMALRDAIAQHHHRVDTRPGGTAQEIAQAALTAGVHLGRGHIALLQISDGILLPQSGVTVFGRDQLGPVKEGDPRHCRFGKVPGGRTLAITSQGTARPADLVLLKASDDLASARALGRVLDVVTRWITEGTDDLHWNPEQPKGNGS